ncbi:MAG: putative Ig domain-containing protein, partial [Candidatus Omnitrophica bacterium]|nr:putative Ig domain-containing protein [Candidatus Omnitrophota bacterium]
AETAASYDATKNNRIDATHKAYWLPGGEINGEIVAFSVVAVDNEGRESTIPVEVTVYVSAVNDVHEGEVTIIGTAALGETLTADVSGIRDEDGLGMFSYQWFSNGASIPGATAGTYTLTENEFGKTVYVTVRYIDGNGVEEAVTSASTDEVINPNNTPPVLVQPIPDGAIHTEESYAYDVSAHFRDDDLGDTLRYSATNSDGSGLPAWLTIDPVTGILGGTPVSGDIGIHSVFVTATDRAGSTIEDMFRILVTNRDYGETEGNDRLVGDAGDDTIFGAGGDDRIIGRSGEDILVGGTGDDTVRGDNGNDELYGGNGTDSLSGGGGNDLLYGDDGNDTLSGQGGRDTLYGGNGDDTMRGGGGNDLLYGDDGNDTLFGQGGNDTIHGGTG